MVSSGSTVGSGGEFLRVRHDVAVEQTKVRSAYAAWAWLWVTMTTVVPALAMSVSMPMTASPLTVSRLPVGSSARIGFGAATKRARRDTLLLAAGQLLRQMTRAVRQSDPLQRLGDTAFTFGGADAAIDQRDLDIFGDGEFVDQIEALEDKTDMGPAQ